MEQATLFDTGKFLKEQAVIGVWKIAVSDKGGKESDVGK